MPYSDWSLAGCLYFLELYNGIGYRNKGIFTPYLWGMSNYHYKGKYVDDGEYDPNYINHQIGCAVILKSMVDCGWVSFNTQTTVIQTTPSAPISPIPVASAPVVSVKPVNTSNQNANSNFTNIFTSAIEFIMKFFGNK